MCIEFFPERGGRFDFTPAVNIAINAGSSTVIAGASAIGVLYFGSGVMPVASRVIAASAMAGALFSGSVAVGITGLVMHAFSGRLYS
ncbi:MAG: hypothetical protein CMO81_11085 [Waddliaceae bacterium]|nr:hypothetical protein [Waddliaceae bacterium]